MSIKHEKSSKINGEANEKKTPKLLRHPICFDCMVSSIHLVHLHWFSLSRLVFQKKNTVIELLLAIGISSDSCELAWCLFIFSNPFVYLFLCRIDSSSDHGLKPKKTSMHLLLFIHSIYYLKSHRFENSYVSCL